MYLRQLLGNLILHDIGVLELVDHEVDQPLSVPIGGLREPGEERVYLEQEVVEVHGRAACHQLLVTLVDPEDNLVEVALAGQPEPVHAKELALGGGDGALDRSWGEGLGVYVHLSHAALYQLDLVGVVVDHKVPVQAQALAVAPQNANAQRMEGADD